MSLLEIEPSDDLVCLEDLPCARLELAFVESYLFIALQLIGQNEAGLVAFYADRSERANDALTMNDLGALRMYLSMIWDEVAYDGTWPLNVYVCMYVSEEEKKANEKDAHICIYIYAI